MWGFMTDEDFQREAFEYRSQLTAVPFERGSVRSPIRCGRRTPRRS
jgi:hypothetical protein